MARRDRWWMAFMSLCALTAVALLPRLWELLPLYMDSETRAQVERALQVTAASRGWLVSDLSVVHIDAGHVLLWHRFHQRALETSACVRVAFTDFSSMPCSDS